METGATIWANFYIFKNELFQLFAYQMNVHADVIWVVSAAYQTNFYRAVISKIDQDGILIDSFVMLDPLSSGQ